MPTHIFSKREEILHAITHGIGALLSIAGLVLLIVFSSFTGDPWKIVSVTIFGTSMLIMYISSTLVHSFSPGMAKDILLILDHSSFYLFIIVIYPSFFFISLKLTTV